MKEILKHFEPPFVAYGSEIHDDGGHLLLDVGHEFSHTPDQGSDQKIAQEIAAALNKAVEVEGGSALSGFGQIRKGYIIEYASKDGEIKESRVKEVLHAGTEREEVIISRRKNHYFITKMVLDGTSWACDVRIKAIPL